MVTPRERFDLKIKEKVGSGMAFTGGKDGSKGFVKRVTSTFSIRKKNTTSTGDPKGLPRSKSTGTSYDSRRFPERKVPDAVNTKRIKSAGVSPQPRREKIDGSGKQLMKMRYFDDSDSIWLSSDCASSNSLLGERRLSVSFHFSVDEKIVSWLSNVANSSLSLNEKASSTKEYQKSSKKAKCSVSRNTKESVENIRMDGKVCNSTGKSLGIGSSKSSTCLPKSNKTWPQKSSEESSSSDKFVTATNSISPDSTFQSHEEKKLSFSLPSFPEQESENSPSPVKSTVVPFHPTNIPEASTDQENSLEKDAETGDSKNKTVVEPLFWPFEQKFDWTTDDILKHFSISPRRKKLGTKSAGTSPRSTRAELQTRKPDLKEGCKRKIMFNGPGSKSTRVPDKRTISNSSTNNSTNTTDTNKNQPMRNPVKRNKSLPSRLRKSGRTSKVVPIEATEEIKEIKELKTPKKLIMTRKSRTFLEDDFALMNDFSIEKAVGLCEFRGREGIDTDSNSDVFLFDDSL